VVCYRLLDLLLACTIVEGLDLLWLLARFQIDILNIRIVGIDGEVLGWASIADLVSKLEPFDDMHMNSRGRWQHLVYRFSGEAHEALELESDLLVELSLGPMLDGLHLFLILIIDDALVVNLRLHHRPDVAELFKDEPLGKVHELLVVGH